MSIYIGNDLEDSLLSKYNYMYEEEKVKRTHHHFWHH